MFQPPSFLRVNDHLERAGSTSKVKQVIVSTQSVELLNEFDPEDVIVVDLSKGRSRLRRLNQKDFSQWLEDYSLGELWLKNILGGRPAR